MDEQPVKEQQIREGFWNKVKVSLGKAHFLHEAIAAYYCAFDKDTPLHVKATLIGALAYFILPLDMVSDFLPLVGFTDDATILFAAIRTVGKHITDIHRLQAREKLALLLRTDS